MAEPAAASSASMVCRLVLAGHWRIDRLFTALDEGQRPTGVSRARLSRECYQLVQLVNVHMAAAEEICYPVLLSVRGRTAELVSAAIADHGDIHEALAEAELAPAASAAWSRAVADAAAACAEHFASEEHGLLPEISAKLNAEADKTLAGLWQAFTASEDGMPLLTGTEAWHMVAGSRLA